MERASSGVERNPHPLHVMTNQGTPFTVAMIVGLALVFLLFVRASFRGSVVVMGG